MGRDFLSQLPGRAANVGGLGLDLAMILEASQSPGALQALLTNQALARTDPALRGELERSPFLAGALGGLPVHSQPVPPNPSEIAQLGQLPVPARIGAYGALAEAPGRPRELRPSLPPLSAASRAQAALESAEEQVIAQDPTAAARAHLRIPQPIPPGTNVRLTRIGPSGPVYEVVQPGGDLQPTNVGGLYRDPASNKLVRAPTAPGVAATAHADAMADTEAHKLGFRNRTDPGYIATKQAQAGMVPATTTTTTTPTPTTTTTTLPGAAGQPGAAAEPGVVPLEQLDLDAPLDETPGRGYPSGAFIDTPWQQGGGALGIPGGGFTGPVNTVPGFGRAPWGLPPTIRPPFSATGPAVEQFQQQKLQRGFVPPGGMGYPSPAFVDQPTGRPALPPPSSRGPSRTVQTQQGAMSVPIRPPVGAGKTSDFSAISAQKALGIAQRAKEAIVRLRQAGILTDNAALAITGWNRGRLELAARSSKDSAIRHDAAFLLRNLIAAVPTFARGFGEQRVNQQEEQRLRETFAFNTIPADYAEAVIDNYIELFDGGGPTTSTTLPTQGKFLGFVGEGSAR